MSKFLWAGGYIDDSLRGYFFKVNLEYPQELHELHSSYPLTTDKIEINIEILSNYHLKIADDYNISTGNVKKTSC